MHIGAAAHALQCTASALAGTPLAPGTLPTARTTSLHADARGACAPAAPADVEAELLYSDLDEEYRRELACECDSITSSSCVDDEHHRCTTVGGTPSSVVKMSTHKTNSLLWWLHMCVALLLPLVLRRDVVLYGMLSTGVLGVWAVDAVRHRVLPGGWGVAIVALTHALACVLPTPIWRDDWRLQGNSFWLPWVQRVLVRVVALMM